MNNPMENSWKSFLAGTVKPNIKTGQFFFFRDADLNNSKRRIRNGGIRKNTPVSFAPRARPTEIEMKKEYRINLFENNFLSRLRLDCSLSEKKTADRKKKVRSDSVVPK